MTLNINLLSKYIKHSAYLPRELESNENIIKLRKKLDLELATRFENSHKEVNKIVQNPKKKLDQKHNEISEFISYLNKDHEFNQPAIYTISPKVAEYAKALSETIYFNSQKVVKKNPNITRLFEHIQHQSKYSQTLKNKDIVYFYKHMAFVVLGIIGKIYTSVSVNGASIKSQSLKNSIAHEFINCFLILSSKCENHDGSIKDYEKQLSDYKKILSLQTEKQIAELGMFLVDCLEEQIIINPNDLTSFSILKSTIENVDNLTGTKKVNKFYSLSTEGQNLLKILPNYGNDYPLLKQEFVYETNKIWYKDRIFNFNMYRYSQAMSTYPDSIIINQQVFDALNYMQKNEYVINNEFLKTLEANLLEFYLIYTDFKFKTLEYPTTQDYVSDAFRNNRGQKAINVKQLTDDYTKEYALLIKFLDIVCLAKIYQNQKIFFNHYLDFRGRIYHQAYPLSPQGDFVSRGLISLHGEGNLTGFDVSASGFQIMGLLSGSLKLLELTNFFEREKYKDYIDLYDYIQKEFINKNKKQIKDCLEISDDLDIYMIFDRDLIKSISMCLIYGEQEFNRSQKLNDKIAENLHKVVKLNNLIKIATLFDEFIKTEFPEIIQIQKFLQNLVKLTYKISMVTPVTICANVDTHIQAILAYRKMDKEVISFKKPKTNKIEKVTFKLTASPLKTDKKKTQTACLANYIHMVDSMIATNVINKCRTEGIKLFTIHDCFYVNEKYEKKIKEIYFKTCMELTTRENHPLTHLLKANEIKLDLNNHPEFYKEVNGHIDNLLKIQNKKMGSKILKRD